MKRILIFSTAYLPLVGGAEIAIKEIADRLTEYEFDLICARLNPALPLVEKIGNVTVHRLGSGSPLRDKLLAPYRAARLAHKLNTSHRYDSFWVMMVSYVGGGAYIYNMLHPREKVPIVLTLQEGDSEAHLTRRWGGLIDISWRAALKRTTILTAISAYLLKRGKRLGFCGQAELIPNGVDIERFSRAYPEAELDRLKEHLGKRPGDAFLITTSRLNVKNAVGDVISALALLPEHVKFLVLGTGELESSLKRQVDRLGVANRVIFAGLISHDEIPKYLRISDVFIRPSLSEGMGNSFIEAMAAGLPVIGTPVGGIPDFLKDGETGVFCKLHDPRSIADAANLLLGNAAIRQKLIENGRALAQDKYDWNLIAEEMRGRVFERLS